MFPWFSIQHNAWYFEVSEIMCMVRAQRTEGSRKINQLGLSLQHLLRYADEEEDMLNRIAITDESWVHHYQPESKRASVKWKHPNSPSTKKFKVTPPAGKVILTVFWDSQAVLLVHFQKHDENVKSVSYCEVLLTLRDAVRRKRRGKLAKGVLLHHDNARATQERIQELQWELPEHPPYSPDLAPNDFRLFPQLKNHLDGKRFADDGRG
jgi:histone-lysine N-methyltransferase SETMAR